MIKKIKYLYTIKCYLCNKTVQTENANIKYCCKEHYRKYNSIYNKGYNMGRRFKKK